MAIRSKNVLVGSFSKGRFGFDTQESIDKLLAGKVTREGLADVAKEGG